MWYSGVPYSRVEKVMLVALEDLTINIEREEKYSLNIIAESLCPPP